MSLAPGDRVDRYTLVSRLGAGAQGNVWKAVDSERPTVPVALKLVDLHAASTADLTRARREASTLASLTHPSLLRCHRTFEDTQRGLLGLVLDFVDGMDAGAAVDDPRFTLAHRFALLLNVARALGFIHASGLNHRDVKPANILLTRDFWSFPEDPSNVKLVDFGIAAAEVNREGLTEVGEFVGTLAYLPPETIDPSTWLVHDVHAARDAFSFGVMAWELLLGGHPTGLSKSARVADYARAYRDAGEPGRPWPRDELLSGRWGAWGDALAQCLALDAERRPASGHRIVELIGEPLEPPPTRRPEAAPQPRPAPHARGARSVPRPAPHPAPRPAAPPQPTAFIAPVASPVDSAVNAVFRTVRRHGGGPATPLIVAAVILGLVLVFSSWWASCSGPPRRTSEPRGKGRDPAGQSLRLP